MNSMDDDDAEFPYSSPDLTPALPAPETSSPIPSKAELTTDDYRTALRLIVGSMLEGNDELRARIAAWREAMPGPQSLGETKPPALDETGGSALLYTLLGLLFKTPDYLNRGASSAGTFTSRTTNFISSILRPIKNSWLLKPVRRRYHVYVARGESVVGSLEGLGRSEASRSRSLVHDRVSDEMIVDFLGYVVEKAKVKELIAEQGMEVTGDAVTEMRERSAGVDSSLDNIVDNILRRQKSKVPPAGS